MRRVVACLALSALVGCQSPSLAFVENEERFFNLVWPEYEAAYHETFPEGSIGRSVRDQTGVAQRAALDAARLEAGGDD